MHVKLNCKEKKEKNLARENAWMENTSDSYRGGKLLVILTPWSQVSKEKQQLLLYKEIIRGLESEFKQIFFLLVNQRFQREIC